MCNDAANKGMYFFFNDTATTEIYTLSLHDALPISKPPSASGSALVSVANSRSRSTRNCRLSKRVCTSLRSHARTARSRSEEHTSELQSRQYLVCRLLLEKKQYLVICLILEHTIHHI